jgi:hypothetical protein
LQGNRPPKVKNRQIRLLQHTQSANPLKGFRILHGRLIMATRARRPAAPTKAACARGNVIGEQAMKLPFSGRNAELKTMNRILTDAARKRAERIEELERQVAKLERQVAHLKQEREPARKANW